MSNLKEAADAFTTALVNLVTAASGGEAAPVKAKKESKAAKEETPKVDGPSAKQVADAVIDVANNKGRDAAVAILSKFKVARVSELKPENYAEALKLATEANAAPAVVSNDSLV